MQYNTKFLMLHMFVLQLLFVYSMTACQTIAMNATAYKYLLRVHKIPVHMGEDRIGVENSLEAWNSIVEGFEKESDDIIKIKQRGTKSENWRKINAEQIASMPSNERQMINSMLKKKHDKLLSMKQQYETLLTKTRKSINNIKLYIRSQPHIVQDLIDHKNIWKQQEEQLIKKLENTDKKLGELDAGLKQFGRSQRMKHKVRTLYSGTVNSGKESKLYYQLDSLGSLRLGSFNSDSNSAQIEEINADVSYKYRYEPVSSKQVKPGGPLTVVHRPASSLEPKSGEASSGSDSVYLKLPEPVEPPNHLYKQIVSDSSKNTGTIIDKSKPVNPKSSQVKTYADVHAVYTVARDTEEIKNPGKAYPRGILKKTQNPQGPKQAEQANIPKLNDAVHSVARDKIEVTMLSINYSAIVIGVIIIIIVIGLFVYIIFKRNTNTNNQNYTEASINMFNI